MKMLPKQNQTKRSIDIVFQLDRAKRQHFYVKSNQSDRKTKTKKKIQRKEKQQHFCLFSGFLFQLTITPVILSLPPHNVDHFAMAFFFCFAPNSFSLGLFVSRVVSITFFFCHISPHQLHFSRYFSFSPSLSLSRSNEADIDLGARTFQRIFFLNCCIFSSFFIKNMRSK